MKPSKYSNLSKWQTFQKALEDLQEKDYVAIVNVDKGGAIVIVDVTDYIGKAER